MFLAGIVTGLLLTAALFFVLRSEDQARIAQLEQRVIDANGDFAALVDDTELLHRRMADTIRGLRSEVTRLVGESRELRKLRQRIADNNKKAKDAAIRIRSIIARQLTTIEGLPE